MPKTQSHLSLDDFIIPVSTPLSVGTNPDIALDVVQFQFVLGSPPRANPTDDGWLDGFWLGSQTSPYLAAIAVGPGGAITLKPGTYTAWIKITDNPTVPVAAVDTLRIT